MLYTNQLQSAVILTDRATNVLNQNPRANPAPMTRSLEKSPYPSFIKGLQKGHVLRGQYEQENGEGVVSSKKNNAVKLS